MTVGGREDGGWVGEWTEGLIIKMVECRGAMLLGPACMVADPPSECPGVSSTACMYHSDLACASLLYTMRNHTKKRRRRRKPVTDADDERDELNVTGIGKRKARNDRMTATEAAAGTCRAAVLACSCGDVARLTDLGRRPHEFTRRDATRVAWT